jgi:general secretion pathway protein K
MAMRCNKGSALVAVLWLSAALAAIAFALANTVRGEVERTSTAVDGLRAYYLAEAGVERGILYMLWGMDNTPPSNAPFRYTPATTVMPFSFPSGEAVVEVLPETAKLNINGAPVAELFRLLVALGASPDRAQAIAAGIVYRRSQPLNVAISANATSTFQPSHASFEETEELMALPGITPDLYYGGYEHDAEGRLVPRAGLKDCVSVFGSTGPVDANTAQPAVLAAIGLAPDAVAAIVARRRTQPFKDGAELANWAQGDAAARLRVGGNSMFTLRSTGRLLLPNGQFSDLRRTVAATVKFLPATQNPRVHVLRWYDNAWTP